LVQKLRSAGEIVVVELPGHVAVREELACDSEIVKRRGRWVVLRIARVQAPLLERR
jgi:ATP phosphoribosyltransferase regulatory subunit